MKICVIFGSHRMGGKNAEIKEAMCRYSNIFDFDFIHLSESSVKGCTSCHCCGEAGRCVLPQTNDDNFQKIFDKMVLSDAVFIISPFYASIPSRLTALFERMTSVLFDSGLINTDSNPLLNKKTAIFSYCSCGICDESNIKLIFDKFVMKNYRYDFSTYTYLNSEKNPKEKYGSIEKYVTSTLEKLI